ncbi:TerB family tellurite resistance protein [Parvularcula marina]|uniref:TerB family tellurite resistance protein n=1 Tax=Parvularcula marina TaxID=2292771 RepID=UPI0013142710|nr:TerB family tellurite resistance protein [Parvularcula marina]
MIAFSVLVGLVCILLAVNETRKFRRRQNVRPAAGATGLVEMLTDPKEAAAILLVQVAAYGDGQVTVEQKSRIMGLMSEHFGSDEEEAEGLFSFGRMAVGQIGDVMGSLGRLLRPIREHLTLEEMKGLLGMMSAVAASHERADPDARRLIEETRDALHVDLPVALRD